MSAVATLGRFHRCLITVNVSPVMTASTQHQVNAGYFCIRPHEEGWMVTGKVARQEHQKYTGTDPIEASQVFIALLFDQCVASEKIYDEDAARWESLPPNYSTVGFRPGMAKKLAVRLRVLQRMTRQKLPIQFASACNDLFAKGWPTVPIPRLPWENQCQPSASQRSA